MEPVPNKPLPWKGVFLILLPGLVYLIAQIEQFSGNTNYYVIYYRAAFFLMIPVMLVWIITKRYPVWGLIPFGLFYHLFEVMRSPMVNYLSLLEVENPFMDGGRTVLSALLSDSKLLVFLSSIAICLLLWRYVKQIKKSKWVIGLLSVYFLYSLGQIINYWVFLSKYIFKAVGFFIGVSCFG